MYRQSKPTDCAMRAEKPSWTPGATMMSVPCSMAWRSLLAAVLNDMVKV